MHRINDIPVKVVILNNGYLGMVRQWQELFYGKRYASSVLDQDCPDFVKLADAYGWLGLRVDRPGRARGHAHAGVRLRRPGDRRRARRARGVRVPDGRPGRLDRRDARRRARVPGVRDARRRSLEEVWE